MTQPIIIDTHTHTRASDGTFTPEESVAYAASVGLEVIAKTDHDTTFGNDQAIAAGQKYGVKVIPGIEIDAIYNHQNSDAKVKGLELLGLNINSEKIQPFEEKIQGVRRYVVDFAINAYNEYISSDSFSKENQNKAYPLVNPQVISIDTLIKEHNDKMQFENPNPFLSKGSVIGHIAKNYLEQNADVEQLIERNYAQENAFKNEYMFMFASYVQKVNFHEAIDAVHEAGGKAVIAHPGRHLGYNHGMLKEWELPKSDWFKENDQLTPYAFISDLVNHGLDGIEQYYYAESDAKHGPQQDLINEYFIAIAEKLDLMVTYGSDCHGEKNGKPRLGQFGGTYNYSHLL